MGSPVSPVVANLCMEIIEESAITASATPPKVWKRYVDDSFVVIKKHSVSTFHDTLNSIDPKISFTIETENNGQISFLDTLDPERMVYSLLMFTENLLLRTGTWIFIHTTRRNTK